MPVLITPAGNPQERIKEMQSENTKPTNPKQPYGLNDDRLLLLQQAITDKLARTKDERLVKLYLQQVHEISQQRLQLRKAVQQ